jgi:hypothetical protein
MINGNYWWIYCRATKVDWSERHAGVSVPTQEGSCAEISDIPAPEGSSLVVCIPGEHVRIHKVKAPARIDAVFLILWRMPWKTNYFMLRRITILSH